VVQALIGSREVAGTERHTALQERSTDEVSLKPLHRRQLPCAFGPSLGFDEIASPERKFREIGTRHAFELAMALLREEMSAPAECGVPQGVGTL
jgi:hypothetical protein